MERRLVATHPSVALSHWRRSAMQRAGLRFEVASGGAGLDAALRRALRASDDPLDVESLPDDLQEQVRGGALSIEEAERILRGRA